MSEPNAEQASAGIAETIRKVQAEATSISDATNPTQSSEQVTSQPSGSSDSGGLQSTEKPLNGDEAKSESVAEQAATAVEGSETKQDEDMAQCFEETAEGGQQAGDTTKEGEPAQTGEKRTHPEAAVNEKGEANEGEGTGAKKLKTDKSKPAEEEVETTKGTRKSTRKVTTAKTATTQGKKRSVGRPRKNAPAEKHVEEKDAGKETMDVAPQPVAEHIN